MHTFFFGHLPGLGTRSVNPYSSVILSQHFTRTNHSPVILSEVCAPRQRAGCPISRALFARESLP